MGVSVVPLQSGRDFFGGTSDAQARRDTAQALAWRAVEEGKGDVQKDASILLVVDVVGDGYFVLVLLRSVI